MHQIIGSALTKAKKELSNEKWNLLKNRGW
jgi:hypothetical protein